MIGAVEAPPGLAAEISNRITAKNAEGPTRRATAGYVHVLTWSFLFVFLISAYFMTRSQQYHPDVIPELLAIENFDISQSDPAHMLYTRMGVAIYSVSRDAGYQGDAMLPMQAANTIFAAGAVVLFGLVLRQLGARVVPAVLISIALAFSYGFWTHVADAFFIIPASFFALLALFAALRLRTSKSVRIALTWAALMALGFSLAALTYQANLALFPALLVASWPTPIRRVRLYGLSWATAACVIAFVAGGVWVYQAVTSAGVTDVRGLVSWFLLDHGGMQESLWRRDGINLAIRVPEALLATVIPLYYGLRLHELASGTFVLDRIPGQLALLTLLLVFAYVLNAALHRRPVLRRVLWRNRALAIAGLWLVVPGLAVVWFDPSETKLWLIPMFGFWIVVGLVLSCGADSSLARLEKFSGLGLLMLTAVMIPLGNLVGPIWSDHTAEPTNLQLARTALTKIAPEDLLVSPVMDWTVYVTYLAHSPRAVNAGDLAQHNGRDAARQLLWNRMVAAWENGGRVFLIGYFDAEHTRMWQSFITPYTHLVPHDLEELPRQFAWDAGGQPVWEVAEPACARAATEWDCGA